MYAKFNYANLDANFIWPCKNDKLQHFKTPCSAPQFLVWGQASIYAAAAGQRDQRKCVRANFPSLHKIYNKTSHSLWHFGKQNVVNDLETTTALNSPALAPLLCPCVKLSRNRSISIIGWRSHCKSVNLARERGKEEGGREGETQMRIRRWSQRPITLAIFYEDIAKLHSFTYIIPLLCTYIICTVYV
jgi:hypothetical protein